ncbi:DMT family transporter [Pseudomonas sp. ISL-88]|nr:DMT family transporter [Pseudomonas sp. ISL-88]
MTQRVFLYGLVFMIPFLYIFDFRQGLHAFASLSNVFNMLHLGIGASAVCFVIWNYSVSVLGAVKTSAYIYIVPVVTITASVVFLQEKMTWIALAGGALILCGLYMSEMKPKPKQNTENV